MQPGLLRGWGEADLDRAFDALFWNVTDQLVGGLPAVLRLHLIQAESAPGWPAADCSHCVFPAVPTHAARAVRHTPPAPPPTAPASRLQYWCCASEGGRDTSVFWYHLPPGFADAAAAGGGGTSSTGTSWRVPAMELPPFCDDPNLTPEEKEVTGLAGLMAWFGSGGCSEGGPGWRAAP